MTEFHHPDVYAIRVPKVLANTFRALNLTANVYTDLKALSQVIPLDDVFYFVSEQSRIQHYVEITTEGGLTSFLSHPSNISWLSEVKSKFDKYIEQNQSGVETKPAIDSVLYDDHLSSIADAFHGQNKAIVFEEIDPIKDGLDLIYLFNIRLFGQALEVLGYDVGHRHPIATYTLSHI